MQYQEFTAAELSGKNNRKVLQEIIGLTDNYGDQISDEQKLNLFKIWKNTIGKAPNYEINSVNLRSFYDLKAKSMGTVSDSVIYDALQMAGVTPEQAENMNLIASKESLNAAERATETTFYQKNKNYILLSVVGMFLVLAFIYIKKRGNK